MQDFRKLKVWHKAHRLALAVYEATRGFPKEELFGLTSQSRRSAASIPTNLAEGCGRGGTHEFARFLRIAFGSASELEYHLLLAHDLQLLDGPTYSRLTADVCEIKQMLTVLIRKVAPARRLRDAADGQRMTDN
jgi:four helix bundle protein